jgi:hypothetical protein
MVSPNFTWADIMTAANNFLANEFVAGIIITICALGIVVKLADFLKSLIEG